MEKIFTSKLNSIRAGTKKVGLVRDLVVGKNVVEAKRILSFMSQKGAVLLLKTLNSAIASAEISGVKESTLVISELRIDGAGMLKRGQPASRGRVHPIAKPFSHITLRVRAILPEESKAPATNKKPIKEAKNGA